MTTSRVLVVMTIEKIKERRIFMKAQKLLNSLNFADIVLISKTARPDDSTFPYVPILFLFSFYRFSHFLTLLSG